MKRATIEPRALVDLMSLPVGKAAAAVRWLEGRVENLPKSEETTPEKAALTFGDCVSQEILLTALHAHCPWVEIDAEEDTPAAQRFAANRSTDRVLLDPIDGTLRYLQGDGYYAILLGLERAGRVEAALVGLPQDELVIRAARGGPVEQSHAGGAFEPLMLRRGRRRLLVSYELPDGLAERLQDEGFELVRAAGGAIGVAPLLADTFGAIRFTPAEAGLSRRTWISTLPTLLAGGTVECFDGSFPESYRPGVRGVIVGPGAAEVATLRKLVLGAV